MKRALFHGLMAWTLVGGAVGAESPPQAVNDWYAISANRNASLHAEEGSGAVYDGIKGESLGLLFSYFSPVSFPDGATLSIRFEMSVVSDAGQVIFSEFRLGLFQSGAEKAGELFGGNRVGKEARVTEGWKGFILFLPNTPGAAKPAHLYRREPNHPTSFALKTAADLRVPLLPSALPPEFGNEIPKTFTLTFERRGAALAATLAYDDRSLSGVLENAFQGGYDLSFDAFGLYAAGGGSTIQTLRISHAELSVSPPN